MQDEVQIVFTTFKQSVTKKRYPSWDQLTSVSREGLYLNTFQKENPTKWKHKHDMSLSRLTNTVNI